MLSPSEKPQMRTSLESRLDLFNTVLATHARKENESQKSTSRINGRRRAERLHHRPPVTVRIGWDLDHGHLPGLCGLLGAVQSGVRGRVRALDISHAVFNKRWRAAAFTRTAARRDGVERAPSPRPRGARTHRATAWSARRHRRDGATRRHTHMHAFFLVDLFVNFNTGFVTADGEVVMWRKISEELSVDLVPDRFPSSISPVLDYFIWWAARGTIVMPGGFNGLSVPPSTCDGVPMVWRWLGC